LGRIPADEIRNTFPIRRTPGGAGNSLTLDTCFVDGAAMTVALSRQRYDRLSMSSLRYVELGVSARFKADLQVDDRGLCFTTSTFSSGWRPAEAQPMLRSACDARSTSQLSGYPDSDPPCLALGCCMRALKRAPAASESPMGECSVNRGLRRRRSA
jgi:hypothetical protein